MTALDAVRAAYLTALRAGDRRAAVSVVERARAGGMKLPTLYLEVFQPALREIGLLWEENEITVAEEHLATAITQMAMVTLYDEVCAGIRAPGAERVLVAACTESERHELGLRMVCDFAEMEGWTVYCLGNSVPLGSLVSTIARRAPDAIALSASIAPHLPQLQRAIDRIRDLDLRTSPFILVGGRPFLDDEALAERLGADVTARDAHHAMVCLRERFP